MSVCEVIGFGMTASGRADLYVRIMSGVLAGNTAHAIYRSDDEGATWIQISDAQHQYSSIFTIKGDPRICGRAATEFRD